MQKVGRKVGLQFLGFWIGWTLSSGQTKWNVQNFRLARAQDPVLTLETICRWDQTREKMMFFAEITSFQTEIEN